ncbi:MAG: Lnb N-terminal periplasmic domain-containing protein [Pseudobdellovibrio sp.]
MFAKVLNLVFLVLVILLKAPFSWGFSISRTDEYLKEAQKQNLAYDIKWLKLGHYHKTLLGNYESSFRGPLFINEEGYKSPEKELETDIKMFFSDNNTQINKFPRPFQCQFLARRNWLIKKLNVAPDDILACEERIEWKKQLGATSVSFIFASADLGNPASSFGHTFIKLINPTNAKNKDLIDYGVNFAANANESDSFYAMKGLFGLYGGVYTMLPYHQKIREYINLEGRDLVEYQLSFTPEETDELINHLLELEKSEAPYYFLTDNCSHQLLELFEAVRPQYNASEKFGYWVIPIDTIKRSYEEPGFVVGRKHKKSLNTDYIEGYSHLNFLQKKALDEAVDKLVIPADYELTAKEKAEVYETGMRYFTVKGYRTGEDLDEKKYKLSTARAQLGLVTEDLKTERVFAPENSHDSSAIYLGAGTLDKQNYTSFKFRSAFHDLEQGDMGVVPMSLNNVGTFELRYFNDLQKWSLYKGTILNLINTSPVTQLDKNLSWKVRAEVLDQWRPDLEYGAGYSFELGFLGRSRVASFATARFSENSDKKNFLQAGPELLFISYPFEKLGLSLDLSYLAETENIPYLRFNSKINYEVMRNFDVQLQANDLRDYQLSLVHSFIF